MFVVTLFFAFIFFSLISIVESSCPNKCSGHGKCSTNDQCVCDQYFTFGDCSGRLCPSSRAWMDSPSDLSNAHEYAECSNRGKCDRKTGQCICDVGFTGSACRRTTCPNDCSGNGKCLFIEDYTVTGTYDGWDREKITGCQCDPHYTGHDCKTVMCPKGDDPLTTAQNDMSQFIFITGTLSGQFYLSFKDTYGNTFATDAIALSTTPATTCGNIQTALQALPTSIFKDVDVTSNIAGNSIGSSRDTTNYDPSDLTTSAQKFTSSALSAPSGTASTIQLCIVEFSAGPGATGYQNLLVAHTTASVAGQVPHITGTSDTFTIGEHVPSALSSAAYPLTELTSCSGRGICDTTKGKCTCFLGHKGIACEGQDSLV